MELKDFIKKEPILLKIIYVFGIIFLFLNLNDVTTGKKDVNYIYPILAYSSIILFFIRMGIHVKKSE
ncbi:MAG: hypothetical protein R3342_12985 [Lutibacter sp.]|uniref:hypothetical protein n=1 Tax=Lutibacter sp. TaxID=1925666 RepID=UPI00299E0BAA|nr:hypothetical protein [Lutibacter sp.]MDX1830447.1 hypothetical protein [Lutibacter sp.]